MVGTSGSDGERCAPNDARARTLPALSCALAAAIDETSACELLPSTAVSAGPPPLVGRWRSWIPAALANRAVGRCSAPYRPDELKMIWFGRFLASSTNSFSVL